jgi:hypothetical protein
MDSALYCKATLQITRRFSQMEAIEYEYPITHRQQQFLDAVEAIAKRKGRGATYRELAAETGVAHNAAVVMCEKLIARGFLKRVPRVPSTLTVAKARALA